MDERAKAFNKQVQLTVTRAPPEFKVRDVYLDEEVLGEAFAQGRTQDRRKGQFTLHFDVDAAWDAVRAVDANGVIWTTPDKGETWLNPFARMLNEIASNG